MRAVKHSSAEMVTGIKPVPAVLNGSRESGSRRGGRGGGGAGYALWLDGNLCSGTSMPCDTFGNSCLASSSKFDILEVELWGLSL